MARSARSRLRLAAAGALGLGTLLCGPSWASADTPRLYARSADAVDLTSPAPLSTASVAPPSSPDADDPPPRKPGVQPYDGTKDLALGCGFLTNFSDVGTTCEVGARLGGLVYFRWGLDFYRLTTARDGHGSNTYVGTGTPLGIGFAIRPTRALTLYPEIGARPELHFGTNFGPTVGAFLGVSSDYRPSGWAWGAGLNYRLQTIPYDGFSDVGIGHLISLAFTYHQEDARAD